MHRSLKLIIPIVLTAAVLAGCGGGGSKKTIDIPGGGQVSVSNKLPSGFPSDFPIYGGAKVQGSYSGSNNGISGLVVTWQTGDDVQKVSDFYNNAFKSGEWTSNSNGNINDSSYWSGTNKDGSKTMYAIVSKSGDGTNIVATVGDNQNASNDATASTSSASSKKTATAEANSGSSDTPTSSNGGSEKSPTPGSLPDAVTLAKDFPADRVPLPSGVRVTSSSSFGGGGTQTYLIEYYTKDAPDAVSNYFAGELPKHGWSSAFTSNTNGTYFLTFSAADTSAGSSDAVTVSSERADDVAGYTKVSVTVSITAG